MRVSAEWRSQTGVELIELHGHDARQNLAYEERLFDSLRQTPRPVCLFYINDPCVVAGRGNQLEQWVNQVAVEADGLPLLRRVSGGGAVYHDRHCLNFSFMLPKIILEELLGRGASAAPSPSLYIDHFRSVVIAALRRAGRGELGQSRVSDITLDGLKISGNAQRIAASMVLHHGTLLLRCPLAAYERYLPLPPNRPGIPHRGFVSGLAEAGWPQGMRELKDWLARQFIDSCETQPESRREGAEI